MGRTFHTQDIVPRIIAEIDKMNHDGSLPPGVKVVPFYDRMSLVHVTTHTVLENLLFGCVLVFFIQWIFLGDLRSAIVVGVNIPFALLFSIIILVLQGEDANLLSIGAVDFGIIVDSAVILVENIFRNFQLSREKRQDLLEDLAEGQLGGGSERQTRYPQPCPHGPIGCASSTSAPCRSIERCCSPWRSPSPPSCRSSPCRASRVRSSVPWRRTYGYALVGAVLATFTITPVLASILLPEHVKEVETAVVRAVRAAYTPALHWALERRRIMVGIGAVFLVVTGLLATRLGSEFLPALEEGNYWIRLSMPPTMGLAAGTEGVKKIREILLSHPEIITVVSQHGRPDNGSDPSPFSNVELFVPLKPHSEWPAGLTKDKLTAQLLQEFNDAVPGLTFNFSQNIQDNIEEATSGVKGANSVKIVGHNLEELERLALEVSDQIKQVRGMEDVGTFHVVGQPNLNIAIDREKAARYGLNPGDVNTVIQAAMGGAVATTLLEGDRSWNVTVRLAPKYRDNIEAVGDVRVGYQNAAGGTSYIPLRELATISLDTGASYIYHEAMQRFIPVKFSVRGRDLGSTVAEAQERIAKNVILPTGYRLVWAGEYLEWQQAKHRLEIVVPLSLVLIMVLLLGLFNSLRDSLLALAGIPFAMGGGVIALFVSGQPLSVSSIVGFISLFGVSVMNGILIITYYNQTKSATGLAASRR